MSKTWNKIAIRLSTGVLIAAASPAAAEPCRPGIYGAGPDAFVVIGATLPDPKQGQRFLFRDGSRGATGDPGAQVTCAQDIASVRRGAEQLRWPRLATRETDTVFTSDATELAGRLIEPAGPPDPARPLVVLVHGSEKTSPLASVYAYMLVAQGIGVFAYDKRGTGASKGEYTQNFELLADDAAAALARARSLASGRFGRAGFFGGSQGGWVAPLAATRSPADFVAVGFGLVVSPIEEDREQMLDEASRMHLGADAIARINRLSQATARLVLSRFNSGYRELDAVRSSIGTAPWGRTIEGEYSGAILRMSDADLRRIGEARFDPVGLIWDYDAPPVLERLKVPLLWVLAGEDREAPIAETRSVLQRLVARQRPVDAFVFPHTDHGIFEFRTNPDGSRTITRIADGYLRLLADWIRGDLHGPYGRAQRL